MIKNFLTPTDLKREKRDDIRVRKMQQDFMRAFETGDFRKVDSKYGFNNSNQHCNA